MITDPDALEEFETELMKRTPVDYHKNLEILDAMYEEAVKLGVFPLKDPWEGLENCISLARALNSV